MAVSQTWGRGNLELKFALKLSIPYVDARTPAHLHLMIAAGGNGGEASVVGAEGIIGATVAVGLAPVQPFKIITSKVIPKVEMKNNLFICHATFTF
jgi:hypothetical protein